MLMPKRVKYRRQQRGRMKGKATRGNVVTYGEFGLMATEPCWITANQIEAARIAMTRYTKRGGQGGYNRDNRGGQGGYNRDNRGAQGGARPAGQGYNRPAGQGYNRPAPAPKEGGNS